MNKRVPRKARRGAVFVETIVVLSFFTLCFLGVVYFRELYLGKLHVQRLARASALSHAMRACAGDVAAGLEDDVPKSGPSAPGHERTPGKGNKPQDLEAKPGKGKDALEGFTRSKTGTPLDEITAVSLTTSAHATIRKDPVSKPEGFQSTVAAKSYVTCGDPVSDGQYEEILPHIESVFSSFF